MPSPGRLLYKGFRDLRKSPAMVEFLTQKAKQIVAGCGEGYALRVAPSRNRARVTIFPDSPEAVRDNARHLTLLKNLDRGRD
jgi:hypothetical protein